MVGVTGLEPATSASRTQRSTRLSYTPKGLDIQLSICRIASYVLYIFLL